MTHKAGSEASQTGRELSFGLGGGCNWLENSSTCNINEHMIISKKTERKGERGMTQIAGAEESKAGRDLSLGLGG